jgi:hypothetical protein
MRGVSASLRLVVAVMMGGLLGSVVASAAAQDAPATITVYKLYCADDNRVGQTDFLIGTAPFELEASSLTGAQAFQESDTSVNCTSDADSLEQPPATFTLSEVGDPDNAQTQTVDPVTGMTVFVDVEPGNYTLAEEDGPTSEEFPVAAGEELDITVINFVAESEGFPPNPEDQPTEVEIAKKFCTDDGRVGNVDIFVQEQDIVRPAATADDCRAAERGEVSFTLTNVDDPEETYGPAETDRNGSVTFDDVVPGSYTLEETLTETDASAESEPFDILGSLEETPARIDVVNYVGTAQATETPTPTNTPTPTPTDVPETPTPTEDDETPTPTNTPGSRAVATRPPITVGGTVRTPVTTNPPVAVATRTGGPVAVSTTEPPVVTALPSTGDGSVSGAPLAKIVLLLVGAVALVTLAASTGRRRPS